APAAPPSPLAPAEVHVPPVQRPRTPVGRVPAGGAPPARPVRTLGVPAGTGGWPVAGPGGRRRAPHRSTVGAAGRAVVPAPRMAEVATVEISAG
ncbi:hypothetical protein ACSNN7_07695, partial [Micromonospora sp. URMC 105]